MARIVLKIIPFIFGGLSFLSIGPVVLASEQTDTANNEVQILNERFKETLAFLEKRKTAKDVQISQEQQLVLYALYKEVIEEEMPKDAPSRFKLEQYLKYQARKKLRESNKNEPLGANNAKRKYIETVNEYFKQTL